MRPAGTAIACLLVLLAGPLAAQSRTEELLTRAEQLYDQLDIERALPILRQVVSPASPFEVTPGQRVHAYVLLGASLVLGQMTDSAVLYFRAAIERDPFVDLDAQRFTRAQLAAFGDARRAAFAVGARPVVPARIDPRTERLTFAVVTTHDGALRVELRAGAGGEAVVLFDGPNAGLREVVWNGLVAGRLAAAGRYELTVAGQSRLGSAVDTARVYFELRHETVALEDTLPALRPDELFPEQHPSSAARGDLLRGLGVAAGALLIPGIVSNGRLGGGGEGRVLSGAVAGVGVVVGVAMFARGQRNRAIPENIATNTRSRAERAEKNEGVRRRNAERLAQAKLVITPAAGLGP
jgi:hypothetical protein